MSNLIPKLETARLTLREHRRDDLSRAFLLWSHPTVVRFIGGKPNLQQQCWMRLLNYRGHWDLLGFGYWAVEEKSSGLYIGDVGFADFKRDLKPSFAGAPELGWALMPSHHGQGFATEAVGAALAWGDQSLKYAAASVPVSTAVELIDQPTLSRTVCMIDPLNAPSIRVAEKNGYREYTRTTFADAATILFERPL
jgi:RimJ/RimL family protein N-acetyltransferase